MNQRLVIYSIVAITGCCCLLILFFFDPAQTALFPPCPFHVLTGYYCPGCGTLRCIHALLHGQIGTALALNPLFIASIPFALFATWKGKVGKETATGWCALVLLLTYGVVRNLPVWPFLLLAPH